MAQRAKQQRPNDGNVADTLGWIYIKKNLSDSAIAVFRDLVKNQPERSDLPVSLRDGLVSEGRPGIGRKECEAALRAKPNPKKRK